jgi:hypothetical protein
VFGILNKPFRFQVRFTSDFAQRYINVGVGIGKWH